ncbi:MAG: hypothetical protein KJN79_00655 [Gammaproteobacteria bacterium]|nr:hypothetical protein [Gammaproteobacteria bacterium]
MTYMQASNVVALLQKEPLYYRNFGIWWWHVKREVKRHGFDKDQLYHLGDFDDPSIEPYYEGKTTAELDNLAYTYQYDHTFHKRNVNQTPTPDGEVYVIHDQDAE